MSTNRLEVLRSLVAQNPADAFARYGLAMELARAAKPEEAVEEFQQLLAAHPNYAAAYFHGGQTLEQLGRVEEARALYQQGIAVTTRSGDAHARSELQAALDLLPI
ncbi:MAG: tetratricopeptide repeat protein [Bryobacteraceae bacterium]|jgi:Flp pilus assembly protein TadD